MRKNICLLLVLFSAISLQSQVNVSKYLWQYPLQENLLVNAGLQTTLQDEMQQIIEAGSLFFRPQTCRYSDQINENYFLYQEPGRILQTVALAYPYLTDIQQTTLRTMVPALLGSNIHAPWSASPLARDAGTRREFYAAETLWGLNSGFGNYRPTIQGVYSIWLYLYRTGDTLSVQPYYEDIKAFYNSKVGANIDPGNLYGTMSAHIGMARLANTFNDLAQVNAATGHLSGFLNLGLDIHYVDSMAFYGKQGWNAPYPDEYNGRRDGFTYRGFIFLNLSPEIGRYLKDTLFTEATQRHNEGLVRFPLWWLAESPYFVRWTGDEGIGIPSEIFGMITPVERWVINRDAASMASYMQSTPIGVADCYWIEGLVYAIESNGSDQWVDERITPFVLDITSVLPNTVSLDQTIPAGSDTCIAALFSIVTGGNGSQFTVENGATAELIGGLNVLLKDGTTVNPGGYLHAQISTGGGYCSQQPVAFRATGDDTDPEEQANRTMPGDKNWFRVYPNPTTGIFTVEFTKADPLSNLTIDIFDMLGRHIMHTKLDGQRQIEQDMAGLPPGVYLVKLRGNDRLGNVKIIRQ